MAHVTVESRQLVVDQVTALAASHLKSGLDVSFAQVNLSTPSGGARGSACSQYGFLAIRFFCSGFAGCIALGTVTSCAVTSANCGTSLPRTNLSIQPTMA